MDKVWANRLVAEPKKLNDMPQVRLEAVKAILAERVENGKITPEKYEEIFGEAYE